MLSVIGSLLIGLVVGFGARALKPGDDKLGWIMTALLGVAGSFLASYAGQALGWYSQGEVAGFIASVLGAILFRYEAPVLGGAFDEGFPHDGVR